jgi:hypothetical protein
MAKPAVPQITGGGDCQGHIGELEIAVKGVELAAATGAHEDLLGG